MTVPFYAETNRWEPCLTLCFATILSALKIARFPGATLAHPRYPCTVERQEALPEERPRRIPVYIRMEEPRRFRDATLVRIKQPDRTGGAALPVAHKKGRDLKLCCEFCRLVFPSRVPDACGPRGSSEYTQQAAVSGGVRQLQ